MATTSILGDIVQRLAGADTAVDVLIPPGTDPHDAAPSARQASDLRSAALVVANGLGLESGLADALDAASRDGVVVLEVGDLVDPIPFGDDHDHDHEDEEDGHDGHDHGDLDPHFWHDPVRVADAVPALVDALLDADPSLDPDAVRSRGEELADELRMLDAEIVEVLEVVPPERRVMLTSHDTFGYFAARYDMEVIGVALPGGDTLARPSAREISELVQELREHDVPAVFAENVSDDRLMRTIAAEAGRDIEVVPLFTDALGPPDSGADTYVGMLRTNAELVASALG